VLVVVVMVVATEWILGDIKIVAVATDKVVEGIKVVTITATQIILNQHRIHMLKLLRRRERTNACAKPLVLVKTHT